MRLLVLAVALLCLVWSEAGVRAEREMCGPNTRYRGATIDLDVKDADIHDVYRLLGDVGRVNIVVPDSVTGKVTVRLRRVPWDQVACTVAAVHDLTIAVDGNVLLIRKRVTSPPPAERRAVRPASR